jgi:hypothetical protein
MVLKGPWKTSSNFSLLQCLLSMREYASQNNLFSANSIVNNVAMVRIFEIEIYRDGGSIEFRVERNSAVKHVWLETPFKGEPRALKIDSAPIAIGVPAAAELVKDIQQWWDSLSADLQSKTLEALAHKGPYFHDEWKERLEAIDVSRVLKVRDYVASTYLQGQRNYF